MNKTLFLYLVILLFLTSSSLALPAVIDNNVSKTISKEEVCNLGKNFWVIYDNVCPYCRSARKYIKELDWENKFKFISYRDPLTYKMFPQLTKEECSKDIHMVTPKGDVLVGYQVFRTIIDNLTATKFLNPLLRNDYAEKKLNEIYEKMVKKRTCYYNKSEACEIKKEGNQSQTKP